MKISYKSLSTAEYINPMILHLITNVVFFISSETKHIGSVWRFSGPVHPETVAAFRITTSKTRTVMTVFKPTHDISPVNVVNVELEQPGLMAPLLVIPTSTPTVHIIRFL